MNRGRFNRDIGVLAVLACALIHLNAAWATEEFDDEIERDFNLRSIGQIQLTNLRGNITVVGWSQDKIRVLAKRRVFAESAAEAKTAFSAMDFRFEESDGNIECSAQFGRGLEIGKRIEERDRPVEFQSKMDMTVYAPSKFNLKVWTSSGALSLKGWNSSAELRTVSGDISVESVKGPKISTLCQNCSVKFKAVKGSIRGITDGGNMSLEDVDGTDVFLDAGAGEVLAKSVSGEQLYVTKSGKIAGKELLGHVEFQTRTGAVEIEGLRGFASGKTESGAIQLRADRWDFHDKALIESGSGNISLFLPNNFSAEVDLSSDRGKVQCAFPIQRTSDSKPNENHLLGQVGEATNDLLRVFSETGNIEILRLGR
jgi:DUF4097 and DUF4098 domain-containing protein YvlB